MVHITQNINTLPRKSNYNFVLFCKNYISLPDLILSVFSFCPLVLYETVNNKSILRQTNFKTLVHSTSLLVSDLLGFKKKKSAIVLKNNILLRFAPTPWLDSYNKRSFSSKFLKHLLHSLACSYIFLCHTHFFIRDLL